MKRMLCFFILVCLSAALFTGCQELPFPDNTAQPPRHDYVEYGFSFALSGAVTSLAGNTYGHAVFETDLGQLGFRKYSDSDLPDDVHNAYQLADYILSHPTTFIDPAPEIKILKNGACYFVAPMGFHDEISRMDLMYFVQVGPDVWIIGCTASKGTFHEDAIIEACLSAEFY